MNRKQKDHVPGCLRHSSYSPCSLLAAKYGVQPSECVPLAQFVRSSCPHLSFAGLMTIGMPDYSSKPQNFEVLHLGRHLNDCVLSFTSTRSMHFLSYAHYTTTHHSSVDEFLIFAVFSSVSMRARGVCATIWAWRTKTWSCQWACPTTLSKQ